MLVVEVDLLLQEVVGMMAAVPVEKMDILQGIVQISLPETIIADAVVKQVILQGIAHRKQL